MSDPITAISQSMNADLVRMRAVSQNVTNAGTNGFRALQFLPVDIDDAIQAGRIPGPEMLAENVSLQAGSLRSTGRSLDLAISGNAFFTVLTPEGVRYTRDGAFQLDGEGNLLTTAGFPVLGESGPIRLQDASVTVTLAGELQTDDAVVATLSLATPASADSVRSLGGNLYSFNNADNDATNSTIHQGMLETSNVSVTDEMVRLIELSRHLESVQRAMNTYDRMLDAGINQLGSKR